MKQKRDTLLLLLSAGLRSGGGLLLALALTRLLSPEAFGEFRGAQLLATFSISFLVAGIPQSLLFLYPTSTETDRGRLIAMTLAQLVLFATLLATGLWLFSAPLAGAVSTFSDGSFVACAALLVLGQALSMSAPTVAVARGELRRSARLELCLGIVPIVAAVVPVLAGASARMAILSLGVAHLIVGGLFWLRMLPPRDARSFGRSLLKRQWSLAAPQTLNSILGNAAGQADKLLVAALFLPAQFAIYACGAIEVPLITLFPYVVTKAISPRLARMYTSERIGEFLELWHHAIRVTSLVLLPACLMLALASDVIISVLFPPEYAAAVHPFRVFLLLIPLRLTGYGLILQATGTARAILWAGGSGLTLNLLLAWQLIPLLGPVGAAWSAVLGQTLSVALHLVAIRARLGVPVLRLLPVRTLLLLTFAVGVAGAAGFALRAALGPVAGLVLCIALVPSVFFAIAFTTRTMSVDDLAFMLPEGRPPLMPDVLIAPSDSTFVSTADGPSLEVHADVDPREWDETVRSLDGSLFQSHAWTRYRCLHGRNEPRYFVWRDAAQRPLAAAAGVLKPGSDSWAARVVQRVCFDTGPAVGTAGLDCLNELRSWALGQPSVGELELGSYDMRSPWTCPDAELAEPVARTEFRLDLLPPDEQLRGMRKGTRYSVKKARRMGLTVQGATSEEEILAFCGLYRETLCRLATTKSAASDLPAPERQARSLAYLVERGRGRLILALAGNRPLAGCFFGTFGGDAYYLLNGNSEEGRNSGAVALALVESIGLLAADGITRLNLGGVHSAAEADDHPDHGLWAFKLGLGATPRPCRSGRLVVRPVRAHILHSLTRARRRLGRWK